MSMKKYQRRIAGLLLAALLFCGFPGIYSAGAGVTAQDGTYTLPVSLWNASIDQASMGNDALMQTAKLVVENGKATLYLKFSQMTFSGMDGYLSAFDLLEDITYNRFNYPEQYRLVQGTTISEYDTVDAFNGPDSTDVNCAGKRYPKVIAVPIEWEAQNTWAHVYVPVMGSLGFGDQLCRIHLSWDERQTITEEDAAKWKEYEGASAQESSAPTDDAGKTPEVSGDPQESGAPQTMAPTRTPERTQAPTAQPVNKDSLGVVLSEAKALVTQTDKYSAASLNNLQSAIDNAQKAYDGTTTQTVVDGQTQILREAIAALVEKSAEKLDKDHLADGKYYVSVNLWNASTDKASMGNPALNHTALLTVTNGVYQMEISTHTMTVGTITACLQTLQIKQTDGSYVYADITARNNPDSQPSVFRFTLPSKDEYIGALIDPKVEVMGKDPLPARLKISWETLRSAPADAVPVTEPDTVSATSAAITYKDSKTKIRVHAAANVFPSGTTIQVKRVTSGKDYRQTKKYLTGKKAWRLYRVRAVCEGKDVSPLGMVTISIPVPESYKASAVQIDRLASSGLIRMTSKQSSGKRTFSTNTMGCFSISTTALKSKSSTTSGTKKSTGQTGTSSGNSAYVPTGNISGNVPGGSWDTADDGSVTGDTTSGAGDDSVQENGQTTDGSNAADNGLTQTEENTVTGGAGQLQQSDRALSAQEQYRQEYRSITLRLPAVLLIVSVCLSGLLSLAAMVIIYRRNGGSNP